MTELAQSILGIGVEPKELSVLQVTLRAVVMFVAAILMVRIGDKRFLSRATALDAVLGFILASMLAPTIAAGFVIVLFHRALAMITARWHRLGNLVKGEPELVIKDGDLVRKGIDASSLSRHDIEEQLRLHGLTDISEIALGYLERNGKLSVIKKQA